jgi:hypothetical protein
LHVKSAYAELFEQHRRASGAARLAIREQQADAEILITWVQLATVLLFSLVYAAAPKAFPEMSRFEPVPLVLGVYIAITLSRLGLAYLRRLAGILVGAFVVANVVLLLVLIWSFHIQYMQPPSFSLKRRRCCRCSYSSRSAPFVSMPDTCSLPGSSQRRAGPRSSPTRLLRAYP